ncbi:hypothetical protein BB560_005009, partial [Smittium megazygosporum]
MFKPLEYIFLLLSVSNSVLSLVAPKFELENKDARLSRRLDKVDGSRFTLNCPLTETVSFDKSPTTNAYYQGNVRYDQSSFSYSNPFTLNLCSSGYFFLKFSVNYSVTVPLFFSVMFVNGTKSVVSDPTVEYRFYPEGRCYVFYKSNGYTNYTLGAYNPPPSPIIKYTDNFTLLYDETGIKMGLGGLVTASFTNPSLNKFMLDKQTKARLTVQALGLAFINDYEIKCLATDTCLTGSQAPSVTTTATTTLPGTCTDNPLPTNIVVNDSLTVNGDFTLSLTSNSRDSDLFFGFSDANGIIKDTKFVELQIGLKNGQNTIKDLVTANIKRSNLDKRQGSAKINIVYVNGIYALLSNAQSFTTFKGSNIIPKSLTITPFDGTTCNLVILIRHTSRLKLTA